MAGGLDESGNAMSRLLRAGVLVMVVSAIGPRAQPVSAQPRACIDPGKAMPMVFVHGFMGDPSSFEYLDSTLSARDDIVTTRFDYSFSNREWVTHPNISENLAELVSCLAARSRERGGPGKVIFVTHSMGGLAARAVSATVGDQLALVVTIGTPHLGTPLARPPIPAMLDLLLDFACEKTLGLWRALCEIARGKPGPATRALAPGSNELEALPKFPAELPVLAIVGDITVVRPVFFGEERIELGSDALVDVASATSLSRHPDRGGGRMVVPCELTLTPFFNSSGLELVTGGQCQHSELLENPKVLERINQSLEYAASPELVLRPDGLGAISFGANATAVVDLISLRFGQPSQDTGWQQALSPTTCRLAIGRYVRWGQLAVTFADNGKRGSARGEFESWQVMEGDYSGTPPPRNLMGLYTPEGIGLGAKADELRAAYPKVEFRYGGGGLPTSGLTWRAGPITSVDGSQGFTSAVQNRSRFLATGWFGAFGLAIHTAFES